MKTDTGFSQRLDGERLGKQLETVKEYALYAGACGAWLTLQELNWYVGYPEASISARLRDLRRLGYQVDKRRRGEPKRGLYEYRVSKPVLEQQRLAFSVATASGDRA